jgi:oxygen-independent coproporphyrinogen-3 oxidase
MHRAHNAHQSLEALALSKLYFDNITIDLIYGVPGLSNEDWKKNIETALALTIPHLSCYALTVEPKTPLEKQIRSQQKQAVDPDMQAVHFLTLIDRLEQAGYRQYEISNFAKPGFESKHNQSYWQGKSYLGIGPSAHSYNGTSRQWNVANNQQYISALEKGTIPFEHETLSPEQQCNEYTMTALRTDQGIQLERLGPYEKQVLQAANTHLKNETVARVENRLVLTREGKFLADGIAASLFVD